MNLGAQNTTTAPSNQNVPLGELESADNVSSIKDPKVKDKSKENTRQMLMGLRKNRMHGLMAQRRTDDFALNSDVKTTPTNFFNAADDAKSSNLLGDDPNLINFDEITHQMKDLDDGQAFVRVQEIRKMLSSSTNIEKRREFSKICISKICKSIFLPFIVQKLGTSTNDDLNYEIAWILTNIAAGTSEQTLAVYRSHGLQQLLAKITTPISLRLVDQILWAVANIIGDGPSMRQAALDLGVIKIIQTIVFNPEVREPAIAHNISWMISNILRYSKERIPDDVLKTVFQILQEMLKNFPDDKSVIFDIIWSFQYSLAYPGGNELIIQHGFHRFIIKHVQSSERKIHKTALKTITSMTNSPDEIIQCLLDCDLIDILADYFLKMPEDQKSEVLLALSNIALCTEAQRRLLTKHHIFSHILNNLPTFSEKIQSEASFIFAHLLQSRNVEFIKELFIEFPMLLEQFLHSIKERHSDPNLITRNLDALANLLDMAEVINVDISYLVEAQNVLDSIEELQHHPQPEVYQKAYEIIERYFSDEADLANLDTHDQKNTENGESKNFFKF